MLSGIKLYDLEHSFHLTPDTEQIPASLMECLVFTVDELKASVHTLVVGRRENSRAKTALE